MKKGHHDGNGKQTNLLSAAREINKKRKTLCIEIDRLYCGYIFFLIWFLSHRQLCSILHKWCVWSFFLVSTYCWCWLQLFIYTISNNQIFSSFFSYNLVSEVRNVKRPIAVTYTNRTKDFFHIISTRGNNNNRHLLFGDTHHIWYCNFHLHFTIRYLNILLLCCNVKTFGNLHKKNCVLDVNNSNYRLHYILFISLSNMVFVTMFRCFFFGLGDVRSLSCTTVLSR